MGISDARAENRIALVIGNSNYTSVTALPNPTNDAKAMTKFLSSAGFQVLQAPDLTQSDMRRTIGNFASMVSEKGPDTVALVFYAGHGLLVDGENFLVPVDAQIEREADVPLQATRLADVMNALSSVPSRTRIVILDACRNNPFSAINKTAGRGLAIVDAPNGSLVSYSTAPGTEALDGDGTNSPYTTALMRIGQEPGLPLEQLLKRQPRLLADPHEGGGVGAVRPVAVEGFGAGRGRVRHERAVRGVDDGKAAPRGLVDRRERIVAAGIQDHDAGLARNRGQRVHHVGEPRRLERHVGFALDLRIDRHEEVLAVDLQAVAGIEHQRNGVRSFLGDHAREIADRPAHVALGEIGRLQDLEPGGAQEFRHGLGVVGRVRQRRDRGVVRVADDERNPVLGARIADAHPAGRPGSPRFLAASS